MKSLVLYFSVGGNTEAVANTIGSTVNADIVRIQPIGNKKVILPIGAFQAVFKASPKIDPLNVEPAEYDLIFVGCPVWVGHAAPWMNSLANSFPLAGRNVALFCTCGNDPGKSLEQMQRNFPNARILDTISVKTPMKDPSEVIDWAKGVVGKAR